MYRYTVYLNIFIRWYFMRRKRCCFAGHGKICDGKIKEKLLQHITTLIEEENVKDFWVGSYGDFDEYSASILIELKQTYTDMRIELVTPYLREKISANNAYYSHFNCVIVADIPENTPHKYRILKTNEYMVNKSDYIICYVEHSWGGAAKTFEYAKRKKHIRIINIANNN